MNTMLSGSSAAITVFCLNNRIRASSFKNNHINIYNPVPVINGVLSGLVAITASSNNVTPTAALIIGLVAGIVYLISSKLMERFRIDDPVEAS
mmetsp:Transcript_37326/g.50644  ORF Transcript_37326/g.50644 Transcript_37326/m.50644 type:complete len:93 (-) Transcript_37326:216-494(-)